MPSSPQEKNLDDMFACLKFIGWTDTEGGKNVYDFKRAKSIKDMTFYPVYEERNVYDKECVLDKTYFTVDSYEGRNQLVLKPGIQLSGKITLPASLDGKMIHSLSQKIF